MIMLNIIKVAAVAVVIAGASSSAFAKSHKLHHRAPAAGYDSTQQVAPDGFGFGATQPAYPWLGAPYPVDRRTPSEVSTYIF
jgi:hypothetical protein